MSLEEEIFNKAKVDFEKLITYGFKKEKNVYHYSKKIKNDTFKVDIIIDNEGIVSGKITDLNMNEEYTNFRIKNRKGPFLEQLRNEFESILIDIRNKCFKKDPFLFPQSNRITKEIKEKYNDEPEFQWLKFPGYGVFKNSMSHKWYGIIMNVQGIKINPQLKKEVEIINLKINPNKIEGLLKKDGFYPAYHMNKKNWISIVLDATISDEEIMSFLEESYTYTLKK